LSKYVGDSLVCRSKTGSFGKCGKCPNGFELLRNKTYCHRIEAKNRFDLVRGIAVFLKIAAHAFHEEHFKICLRFVFERLESCVYEIE
jgi:hypothetical protein